MFDYERCKQYRPRSIELT